MKILKIYIIEDHRQRREGIKVYFDSVNRLLSGKPYDEKNDFENCHECFQKHQYEKIEIEEILPATGSNLPDCNYKFSNRAKWVKRIEQILKNDEDRVFLIDFALNSEERESIQRNSNYFRAETTRQIMDYIEQNSVNKEYIIFESVISNAEDQSNSLLDIGVSTRFEHIDYGFMLGDYFTSSQAVYEKTDAISEAFKMAMEVIKK